MRSYLMGRRLGSGFQIDDRKEGARLGLTGVIKTVDKVNKL